MPTFRFITFLAGLSILCIVSTPAFSHAGAPIHLRFAENTSWRDPNRTDSTKTDSVRADSTARADSIRHIVPIPSLGSIDRALPARNVLTDTAINSMDYSTVGDLFAFHNGVFVRTLGSPGQFSGLTINGAGPQQIAVTADGITLNEPMSGAFDLNLYPIEHASRIELISGTRAFVYSFNGAGGVMNFVSKSKRAIHPFSRIRYTEAAYGFSMFDAMVSQDIVRGLNATAGMQHVTTAGRFFNTKYDLWNGRIKLRYNLSNSLNVFASEMYNQTRLGLFGGIVDSIPYDLRFDPTSGSYVNGRIVYAVVDPGAYEKLTRHDVQVGAAARLLGDSTLVSSLTFYHSTEQREYRDDRLIVVGSGGIRADDHWTQWYGARFTHTLIIGRQQVDAGAELERRGVIASPVTGQIMQSRTAVFGKTQSSLLHPVLLAAYARFDNVVNRGGLSFGADAGLAPDSLFELFGGFSHAYRFPSFQERYWSDTVLTPANSGLPEQHDLFEAGIRTGHPDGISGELRFFHRTIHDAYALQATGSSNPRYRMSTIGQRTIRGVSASTGIRLGSWFAEGNAQYVSVNDSGDALLPPVSMIGGLYYWTDLLKGHLNLKVGLRGRLQPSFTAIGYDPMLQRFVPDMTWGTATVGVADFVLIARLGDAHIHFIIDNLFSRNYIITSFYPMPDRQTRFGVSWDFLD